MKGRKVPLATPNGATNFANVVPLMAVVGYVPLHAIAAMPVHKVTLGTARIMLRMHVVKQGFEVWFCTMTKEAF